MTFSAKVGIFSALGVIIGQLFLEAFVDCSLLCNAMGVSSNQVWLERAETRF